MAHDVFISHSAKDKATADAVCAMLESEGIRCWIAPRDVMPSLGWGEAIIDAIEQCRIMVLVFTSNANDSPQIRREVERAVNHGVAILPLRVENVLPGRSLEYFISDVHWLDALTPPLEAHLKNLAGTIKVLLARTEPGALSAAPREAEAKSPESAVPREKAPAPRGFWNARSWTWAAGTVSALLLCAVFVGVHSTSRPAPAASPAPPPGNAASLQETMKTLQDELGSIGTVNTVESVRNKDDGSSFQITHSAQFSDVAADLAQCRVSYHLRVWLNGATSQDKDSWFLLHEVTNVVVVSGSQSLTEAHAAAGHPEWVVTSTTPPVTALVARWPGGSNMFPFTNADLANRTVETLKQAVGLCGGTLAN